MESVGQDPSAQHCPSEQLSTHACRSSEDTAMISNEQIMSRFMSGSGGTCCCGSGGTCCCGSVGAAVASPSAWPGSDGGIVVVVVVGASPASSSVTGPSVTGGAAVVVHEVVQGPSSTTAPAPGSGVEAAAR